MFFDQLVKLCEDKNTTPTKFVTEILHLSSSKVTAWKNGSIPKYEILDSIANYFGVSVGTLFDGKEKFQNITSEIKTEYTFSENEEELLKVFKNLPMKGRVKLLGMVYDFEEQYSKNGTADITQPELPLLNNPLVSENEQKLLEVFHNFTEMEQVKIIERIEEWLETKRRRESENNQPQSEIKIDPKRPWRMTARRTDGVYESRYATPEEIEKLKLILQDSENSPEPEY